ncbi:hypothetical protein SmJEL517_g02272 [Synchytrium microbalum]|uniref:HTH APSES-type domain-containing protein n=1 Tax=Synchytrium microbalum TaxID=1806994 RepID=A0A507C169_9FUNG|nr:uncharacterized protein SmJEL517_g02272 [Synchytrium microbalum]TPX35260.1 hypothetical protein SmJEL517_g02272 [Synchytrium microbalum]
MAEAPVIYEAVYSGVPVYEMMVQDNIPIMRRTSDSWLNGTQILKICGLSKPKRTKILEKEVLLGQHEKIQGGYGKYQGTWIPMEQGRALAQRYGVEDIILPILLFDPTTQSVGPKPASIRAAEAAASAATRASQRQKRAPIPLVDTYYGIPPGEEEASSNQAYSPRSPYAYNNGGASGRRSKGQDWGAGFADGKEEQLGRMDDISDRRAASPSPMPIGSRRQREVMTHEQRQREALMNIFIDDAAATLDVLRESHPPFQIDLEFILDDQNHTALHWAAALARINVMKALLAAGADVHRVNINGETPLIRCVMVTNNYDSETFQQTFDFLRDAVRHVDHDNRTIFHHIACTAGVRGRSAAAKTYISVVSNYFESHPRVDDATFLDAQDKAGDTALHIACRVSCKTVAQSLVRLGCRRDIPNSAGVKAEDLSKDYPKLLRVLTTDISDFTDVAMESSDEEFEDVDEDVPTPPPIADDADFAYGSSVEARERILANGAGAQLISVVQDIVDDAQREFRILARQTEEEIRITQDEMNAASDQLEQARKEQDQLQAASLQLEEVKDRVRILQRQLERMVKIRISNLETPPPAASVTPEELAAELAQLRRRLDYSSDAKKRLSEETETSRAAAEERIKRLKRLISICTELPEDEVVVEDLVEALTSE